jgi:hypothetical protein
MRVGGVGQRFRPVVGCLQSHCRPNRNLSSWCGSDVSPRDGPAESDSTGDLNQSLGGALKIPQELPSLNENWLVLVDKEGNPQLA